MYLTSMEKNAIHLTKRVKSEVNLSDANHEGRFYSTDPDLPDGENSICVYCEHDCVNTNEKKSERKRKGAQSKSDFVPKNKKHHFRERELKILCFCYTMNCHRQSDGGNCPKCRTRCTISINSRSTWWSK